MLGWDEWGQLQSVDAASYTYDFAGRRVSKTLGKQTTYFLYDGDNLIAELDQTGTPTRVTTWGGTGLLSDAAPVGPGWQSRFYLFDAQGNTRTLVSETGVSLGEWAYTAWGSVYRNTPGVVLPFGWQGQSGAYTDAESGLVQRGFRYYAPCLGRFVSRDPIGYAGGLNLYAYCADDPINFTDPMGLQGPGSGLQFEPEEVAKTVIPSIEQAAGTSAKKVVINDAIQVGIGRSLLDCVKPVL